MPAKRKVRREPDRRYVLVIDVGGTHVKARIGEHGAIHAFDSGPKMTPGRMTRRLRKLLGDQRYDAVSIGYPGLVYHGRIAAEPHNLGRGWVGYDFSAALGRPVRIINDAAMQAIGSYRGGRMLFLGLGTGLGATLIVDGVVEPTEVGHMPYKDGRTFEDYLGERGRKRLGNRRWRKNVRRIVAELSAAFEADYIVLGGGNARRLKKLPPGARLGSNLHAFAGGLRLWDPHAGIVTAASAALRAQRERR
ncbi:MAG: ROK family protein [Gammaproteobacteria bacterium]|nr:ROK family protein [Gammaproteobacteria bacterium]MBV9725082.1 ROK family protein [Gammaproteobacteria bacterium]